MKTSKNQLIIIIVACIALATIVVAVTQKETAVTVTVSATPTPEPPTTTSKAIDKEEPGSLYYEETTPFNGTELIKKDVPEWLSDAISKDSLVEVARTIAKKNPKDFKIRSIFSKDSNGFYCWWEGYVEKEGDIISVANDRIRIDINEPTVSITIPAKPKFEFAKSLIELLLEREGKSFWTTEYEHYVEVKEVSFPTEEHKEKAICVDGEFLCLMPETKEPIPDQREYSYANDYKNRSKVWYDNEGNFYCIDSYSFEVLTWAYDDELRWYGTGKVPTLGDDVVISMGRDDRYGWYLVNKGNEVTVFQPDESENSFELKDIIHIQFIGAEIARPFADFQGSETPTIAYVAVPENNTLWKISPSSIGLCRLDQVDVTNNKIFARNGGVIEILATKENEPWKGGSWHGWFGTMIGELSFTELANIAQFERNVVTVSDDIKTKFNFNDEGIIIETEDTVITLK